MLEGADDGEDEPEGGEFPEFVSADEALDEGEFDEDEVYVYEVEEE